MRIGRCWYSGEYVGCSPWRSTLVWLEALHNRRHCHITHEFFRLFHIAITIVVAHRGIPTVPNTVSCKITLIPSPAIIFCSEYRNNTLFLRASTQAVLDVRWMVFEDSTKVSNHWTLDSQFTQLKPPKSSDRGLLARISHQQPRVR